jgi:hypothetical protein
MTWAVHLDVPNLRAFVETALKAVSEASPAGLNVDASDYMPWNSLGGACSTESQVLLRLALFLKAVLLCSPIFVIRGFASNHRNTAIMTPPALASSAGRSPVS